MNTPYVENYEKVEVFLSDPNATTTDSFRLAQFGRCFLAHNFRMNFPKNF